MHESKPYVPEKAPLAATAKLLVIVFVCVVIAIAVGLAIFPRGKVRLWSPYQGGNTGPYSERQSVGNGRPRLQVDEVADMRAYREKQDKLLTTYGWNNRSAGIVRIPIERAMERWVEKGVSQRRAGSTAVSAPAAEAATPETPVAAPKKPARRGSKAGK